MRYYAKEINGKGYLMDKQFSDNSPIATETTLARAEEQANHFNRLDVIDRQYQAIHFNGKFTPSEITPEFVDGLTTTEALNLARWIREFKNKKAEVQTAYKQEYERHKKALMQL